MNPIEELIIKAESGDVEAQFGLATEYWEKVDYEQAFFWCKKAAEQGNTSAQNNIGFMYECGYGVKKNIKRAFDWYLKAERNGHERAEKALKNPIFDKIRIERLIR